MNGQEFSEGLRWLRRKGWISPMLWTDSTIANVCEQYDERGKVKIAIITAAWGRYNIFEFFCIYWSELSKKLFKQGIELTIYCAVSEKSCEIIGGKYGVKCVFIANDPLYLKHNAATKLAQKDSPDYCVFLGSDDIMNEGLVLHYAKLMEQGHDYIATLDWMFFDTVTKKGLYWGGYREQYREGEPCGAGRALSSIFLNRIDWQPWIPGYDKVLDTGFKKNIDQFHPTKNFFKIADASICTGIPMCGLDIKSETNMTVFKPWDNTEMFGMTLNNKLQSWFGPETYKRLITLRK